MTLKPKALNPKALNRKQSNNDSVGGPVDALRRKKVPRFPPYEAQASLGILKGFPKLGAPLKGI